MVALTCLSLSTAACVESGSSTRITPAACEGLAFSHFSYEEPENLKNGFVGQFESATLPDLSAGHYVVTDCRTENSLSLSRYSEEFKGYDGRNNAITKDAPDRREAVEYLPKRLLSDGVRSLTEVTEMAKQADIYAATDEDADQSCGCAAFYPELREDRKEYELIALE